MFGMIDGGVRPNVVAPESSAIVDVRVEGRADADMIESTIHSLKAETPGVSLEIEGAIGRPPMERTAANQQFWQVATDLASEIPSNSTRRQPVVVPTVTPPACIPPHWTGLARWAMAPTPTTSLSTSINCRVAVPCSLCC